MLGESSFVAYGAVPRNNLGLRISKAYSARGACNHSADVAAATCVDKGIGSVEPHIAHVQNVSVFVADANIGVRMRRLKIGKRQLVTVEIQLGSLRESLLRPSCRRRRIEVQTE